MSEITYYQRNRDLVLDRAKKYYENNKKVLRENEKNKYRDLSNKEGHIKREYGKKIDIIICLKKRNKN